MVAIDLCGGELAQDLRASRGQQYDSVQVLNDETGWRRAVEQTQISQVLLVLPTSLSESDERLIDSCARYASQQASFRVCLISSFSAHLDDTAQRQFEKTLSQKFETAENCRVTILRTGHLLNSTVASRKRMQRLAPIYPLLTKRWKSCFLDSEELFATICELFEKTYWPRSRVITLLGRNRLLRDVLREHELPGAFRNFVCAFASVARAFGIGSLLGWAASFKKSYRIWQCQTLQPESTRELLALYNPYNHRHVAIAGYNTGVVHFGWRYPDQTIVKTTASGECLRIGEKYIDVDAGVTLKRVNTALGQSGDELYVLPNYSYISMGTTFFVPIHGSGSEVSVLGETIEKVLLYDPHADHLLSVWRDQPKFREAMYDPTSGLLALRLRLRTREKSRYFVRKEMLTSPAADELWGMFSDSDAANVEIRKSQAAAHELEVSRYYTVNDDVETDLLEVPKDRIGRLWDRLEENRITSYLFHAMVRRLGFHVELFLDREQFRTFWQRHGQLPLSKIQLRFVRRDDLPNSPIGRSDCISIDLFMKRKNRHQFLSFMKAELPDAKHNPGKHSM